MNNKFCAYRNKKSWAYISIHRMRRDYSLDTTQHRKKAYTKRKKKLLYIK